MKADDLSEHLMPLARLVGRTFRGELAESTPEKPMVDVSRWERAMNGMAVRNLHSVNDGEYGGETIIYWDREKQSLVYYYFTTAGFFTHGTMAVDGNRQVNHELVTGNKHGITEVRSTAELTPDGSLKTRAEYLQNGKWVEGHAATYFEAPDAEVRFR